MLSSMLVVCTLALSAPSLAQDTADPDPTALEARVAELEAALAAQASTDEQTEDLRERIRALEAQLDEIARAERARAEAVEEIPLDLETKVNGFGSTGLDQHGFDGPPQFQLGDLSLVYSANLDRKISFQVDLVHYQEAEFVQMDIAALEVGFHFSQGANLNLGRSFFPLSYWATESLHGAYRFTPVSAPSFLRLNQDGTPWFPLSQVGATLDGSANLGFWQLGYVVGVTNGRAELVGQAHHVAQSNFERALLAGVSLEAPSGLLIGAGVYYDNVNQADFAESAEAADTHDDGHTGTVTKTNSIRRGDAVTVSTGHDDEESSTSASSTELARVNEGVGVVYLVYTAGRFRLQGEGFAMLHWDEDGSAQQYLAYGQASYEIKQVAPYLIGEVALADETDPLYSLAGDPREPTADLGAGIRWDAGIHVALKLQTTFERHLGDSAASDEGWIPSLHAQAAAGF